MCSYWRRSFAPTPRRRLPLGMTPPPGWPSFRSVMLGRTDGVLPRLGRGVDLFLGPVQHVLGFLADRADHVGRAPANTDRSAFGVSADLFAPVPDGEPSDERSHDESKHRRPPFMLRRANLLGEQERCHSSRASATAEICVDDGGYSGAEHSLLLGKSYRPGHFSARLSSRPARAASRSNPGRMAVKKAF